MHISKIKVRLFLKGLSVYLKFLEKNPVAVKALHCILRPSFSLDYNLTRRN